MSQTRTHSFGRGVSSDETDQGVKRQRPFIARQACETCRANKTRCDQDTPCSYCSSRGISCVYAERRATKNEASMSTIMSSLNRIETKIARLSANQGEAAQATEPALIACQTGQTAPLSKDGLSKVSPYPTSYCSTGRSASSLPPVFGLKLSFSAHQTINWPGVVPTQGRNPSEPPEYVSHAYPTILETQRAQLAPSHTEDSFRDLLSTLSMATVKCLSDAYFRTFNRIFPYMDYDFYYQETLPAVLRDGFDSSVQACLVLGVMALGCLGIKAYEEGGYPKESSRAIGGLMQRLVDEDTPGFSLFYESQRRVGLCSCSTDIQSSQYYLTAALYYAQLLRPSDQWMMADKVSTNCAIYWNRTQSDDGSKEWEVDMQSRIFWSCMLMDIVNAHELELPNGRLREYEESVPLPRFVAYSRARATPLQDESYYHYHFLSQIAHRIILTRIRDELFYHEPSIAVAIELRHQLEQWYTNLPHGLQREWSRSTFECPAEAVAVGLLRTRYCVAIYHLGRPFLFKALKDPTSLTEQDLRLCSESMENASYWPIATGTCQDMASFMPLKFLLAGTFFGQLLIAHGLNHCADERVRKVIPKGFDKWTDFALEYIPRLSHQNPTVEKDMAFLSQFYDRTSTSKNAG